MIYELDNISPNNWDKSNLKLVPIVVFALIKKYWAARCQAVEWKVKRHHDP